MQVKDLTIKLTTMTIDQEMGSTARHNEGKSKLPWIVLGILVIVLVTVGIVFRKQAFGIKTDASISMVYLTNGQVLFGEATVNSETVTIRNAYVPQQVGTTTQQSLVKFGEQPYGLNPEITVNRASVLMMAELQASSSVVTAIKQSK